jgi:D-glycero-D-manno-heptose 1,7-bisphosphate phosphatase
MTKPKEKSRRVLYTDLDGTIRKGKEQIGRFVNKAEDVELFDGVKDRLWRYKRAGWRIIGVTNQGGVALGILSTQDLAANLTRTHELTGFAFDKVTSCMHHPDASDPEYAVCWCRKPRIGGLVVAASVLAQQFGEMYPPHLALFVGDRPEDEQCAANAGIPFMWAAEWRERGEP